MGIRNASVFPEPAIVKNYAIRRIGGSRMKVK
jgi:hypothetical protein